MSRNKKPNKTKAPQSKASSASELEDGEESIEFPSVRAQLLLHLRLALALTALS